MTAYASQYIHRALNQERLDAPNLNKAGEHKEVITSIYDAHRAGGVEGARAAWRVIESLRPQYIGFPAPKLLIPADELKNLSKPEYLIGDYPFYAFGMNALVGVSGGGKSFVALDFCAKLVKAGHECVYIAGEGLAGYASRWEVLKDYLQVGDESKKMRFYQEPVQFIDPASYNRFIDEMREDDVKPKLFVIDTLARSMVGADENSSMEMGRFIDAVDRMRRELNCGVLIVHHTGKNGDIRGSTALRGACDSVLILSKQDALLKLSNSHDDGGKNKHDREFNTLTMELVERAISINGVDYRSAVMMPAAAVIRSPRQSGQLTPSQRTVLEFLDTADKAVKVNEIVSSTNVSQAQVYRVMKELKESKYVVYNEAVDTYGITDEGKQAWYGA